MPGSQLEPDDADDDQADEEKPEQFRGIAKEQDADQERTHSPDTCTVGHPLIVQLPAEILCHYFRKTRGWLLPDWTQPILGDLFVRRDWTPCHYPGNVR